MCKILASSDWHGTDPLQCKLLMGTIKLEGPDIICIAGDIFPNFPHQPRSSLNQDIWFNEVFIPFCKQVKIPVVFTLGNHDYLSLDCITRFIKDAGLSESVFCLINEHITISGVKFYGNPWCLPFYNWNFEATESNMLKHLENMDNDVDVFLCHSPAYGHNDAVNEDAILFMDGVVEPLGSKSIRAVIENKQPKWTFVGHIHTGSHAITKLGKSNIINVSILDENYNDAYAPFVMDI